MKDLRHAPNFGLERTILTESGNQSTYQTKFNNQPLILEVKITDKKGVEGALVTAGDRTSFLPQRIYPQKNPQELMERAAVEYMSQLYSATDIGC
jgi:hypothetical protein